MERFGLLGMLRRNPGVALVWVTNGPAPLRRIPGQVVFEIGDAIEAL